MRPTKGQIDDLVAEIQRPGRARPAGARHHAHQEDGGGPHRVPPRARACGCATCTARSTRSSGSRSCAALRLGDFDVLVGINLLREGLDLPEVSLVAILDADKEGFLRSETSLIQTIGRAARNVDGQVIMYADQMTDSMRQGDLRDQPPAQEAARVQRRARHRPADGAQEGHRHPRDAPGRRRRRAVRARSGAGGRRGRQPQRSAVFDLSDVPPDDLGRLIQTLQDEMHDAATDLRFEEAARLRDEINELKRELRAAV